MAKRRVRRVRRRKNKLTKADRTNIEEFYRMRSRGNPHSPSQVEALAQFWKSETGMNLQPQDAVEILGHWRRQQDIGNLDDDFSVEEYVANYILPKVRSDDLEVLQDALNNELTILEDEARAEGYKLDFQLEEEDEPSEQASQGQRTVQLNIPESSSEDLPRSVTDFSESISTKGQTALFTTPQSVEEESEIESVSRTSPPPQRQFSAKAKRDFEKGTAFDRWREKKFRLRSARIQKELGPFFFFLQMDKRTLPLPSVDDWSKALKAGQGVFKENGEFITPSGEAFPTDFKEDAYRRNVFLYVRNRNTFLAPTQMFIPSQNPTAYRTRRRESKEPHWVPSLEFISRPDISSEYTWPTDFVKIGEKWGLPSSFITATTLVVGDAFEDSPYANQSWYQMLHNYMNTFREKGRTGKFGAYGVLIFEEENGKPVLKAYFPPQIPSFTQLGIKGAQQMRLPSKSEMKRKNPKRRISRKGPKRVIKIVRKVKRR